MVLVVDAVFDAYWADLVRYVLRRGPMARTKLMTTGAVATNCKTSFRLKQVHAAGRPAGVGPPAQGWWSFRGVFWLAAS
jgi:hypothetical protein